MNAILFLLIKSLYIFIIHKKNDNKRQKKLPNNTNQPFCLAKRCPQKDKS